MTKCNRCNLPIDRERDAFVTMPNAEPCGFRARRPTAFAHARCFEGDIRAEVEREQKNRDAELMIRQARVGSSGENARRIKYEGRKAPKS
jgi:hypothetical protein